MNKFSKPFERINKRTKIAIIVTLLILGWLLSSLIYKPKKTFTPYVVPAVSITTEKVEPTYLEIYKTLPATLNNDNIFELRSKLHGRVKKILVEEGNNVKKNEVILELEDETLDAEIAQAHSLVEQQILDYQANKALESNGFTSRLKLATALANLKGAETKLLTLQLKQRDLKIKAPFDGIVDKIQVQVGDLISNTTLITNIINPKKYYFSSYLSEQDIQKVDINSEITATEIGGKNILHPVDNFKGKITFISKVANSITKTYLITLELERFYSSSPATIKKQDIYPPLNISINLLLGQERVFIIPTSSLVLNEEGLVGFKILTDKQHIKFIPVEILKDLDKKFAVKPLNDLPMQPLNLITNGAYLVKEGVQNIHVTELNKE